jgi:hypothetical protein
MANINQTRNMRAPDLFKTKPHEELWSLLESYNKYWNL